MASSREYPERPVVGVGGVVIENGRALLIRRGGEPLKGQWSIPGGTLETGETLEEGTRRELEEETGLSVRVVELIEVFERIFHDQGPVQGREPGRGASGDAEITSGRPRFHFVILDYLCERISGEARAGGDVTDVAWATEDELERYHLTPTATRILKKAFAMRRGARPPAKMG
ncbi:MAG TPA: NUDIX hydrolase [Candidatus Binatia bacterium]|nr:NUDIX hydrolase [Candidatus Binatia bacterium]